jgi:hypothetical protein
MSREAMEVGAFTWSRIQRLYDSAATAHWQRCESEGLQCPQEVFTQIFHEQVNSDWGRVSWELREISGIVNGARRRSDARRTDRRPRQWLVR